MNVSAILFWWLMSAGVCGAIGARKSATGTSVILGLLLGPLAIPIVLMSRGYTMPCPMCKEPVRIEALVCKHCKSTIGVSPP